MRSFCEITQFQAPLEGFEVLANITGGNGDRVTVHEDEGVHQLIKHGQH